jgi:hypothetical protein
MHQHGPQTVNLQPRVRAGLQLALGVKKTARWIIE